jgi:hypothetical protein
MMANSDWIKFRCKFNVGEFIKKLCERVGCGIMLVKRRTCASALLFDEL